MALRESGEMYLETILLLSKNLSCVRSIDIVNDTGYQKSSVSKAINKLKDTNYIIIDCDGHITLTDSGKEVAERIYERHLFFKDFLMSIGVSETTALEDACKMEHYISEESFIKFKHFIKENKNG